MLVPCYSRCCDRSRLASARRAGFSLIELLVVIAIVALLVTILLPSLASARNSTRDGVCLSNQRQLVVAWTAYTDDYRAFPLGSGSVPWAHLRYGWGGVNWYGDGPEPALPSLIAARPLNPYVSDQGARIDTRLNVYRCPRDTGCYQYASGTRAWDAAGERSSSGEGTLTAFGVAGTSYQANEWMYCRPNDQGFLFVGAYVPYRNFIGNNAAHSVIASPSRLVVMGDIGAVSGGRIDRQYRLSRDYWSGFWHKDEHGQLGFLDGSARLERMGAVNTQRYTFFMNPAKHTLASKFNAYHW